MRTARKMRIALVFVALCAPLTLLDAQQDADPTAPAVAKETSGETLYTLIIKGGGLMLPIALCSIVILTLAFERAISLRVKRTHPPDLLESVYEILPHRRAGRDVQEEASDVLDESGSVLGNLLRVGVLKVHRDAKLTETVLRDAATKELHLLRRRLRPFEVVASLAPLLGLLGTVYGMIVCFENVASTDVASRTETLANGIYRALVTTAAGLTVAIPSVLLFHFFRGKVDRIADQLEESATEFLDFYYDEDAPQPAGKPAVKRPPSAAAAAAPTGAEP